MCVIFMLLKNGSGYIADSFDFKQMVTGARAI
jgi:hypothetical protein